MKIDWKRKLSSRKFWAMLAGFLTGVIVFATSEDRSPEKLVALIEAGCSLFSYIIGEAIADSGNHNNKGMEETDNGITDAGQDEN